MQKINEACLAQEENVTEPQLVEDDDSGSHVAEATSAMNDMFNLHHNDDR